MSISRADFLRTLPAALGPRQCRINQDIVIVEAENFRLTLLLSDEGVRRIAAMTLPVLKVDFTFEGGSRAQIGKFMTHFDRCYQRGGG